MAVQATNLQFDYSKYGFRNEENQFDFYAAMEKFLDQHIGKSAN